MSELIKIGDEAPDFELDGRFNKETFAYDRHRLSKALEQGPVVLHFFPAPLTAT